MRCASGFLLCLVLAGPVLAAGINTDAALTAGQGQVTTRTKVRFADLENEVERYLAQQTLVYGATHRLSVIAAVAHVWHSPGPDGLGDLIVRGRFRFLQRDEKRATLSLALLLGVEVPLGEEPIGSPDGGGRVGLVGTWERRGWRVDADVEKALRPNAPDLLRADVALIRNIGETDRVLWQAVLELNYGRSGRADVLFLSPGLVYEISGWKLEVSVQVNVADDARGPVEEYAVVLSVVHVF